MHYRFHGWHFTFSILFASVILSHAHAQDPARPMCPSGYELIGAVCISSKTGDVINPLLSGDYSSSKTHSPALFSCEMLDLAAFTLLEHHGNSQTRDVLLLVEAAADLEVARAACNLARPENGLSTYKRLIEKLSRSNT